MRKIAVLIALTGVISFQGCSYITVLRTKEMKAENDTLSWKIDSLQSVLKERQQTQDELLRLIRADQQVHFSGLEKKVADLESRLSENQYRLSRIDEKTADFQKKLEAKLSADSAAAQTKQAEVEKLFQIASGDFTAGRFDIALNGFKDLLIRFPDAPEGQEAQYWIAECEYAKKSYEDAEKTFLLYIKQNPQGPKICVTLYKLGLTYEKMRKSKSKDLVWKKLADQCPDSEEAKLVKSRRK